MKHALILVLAFLSTAASAEITTIPWKGDYAHNSAKTWSRDNPDNSGYSKNFLNGAPEEGGKVQKLGYLNSEIWLPPGTKEPVAFMIVMHGCTGYTGRMQLVERIWESGIVSDLLPQHMGVLLLDSFTTRGVEKSCGLGDLHWARRRADDAFSALDYLIENKLAIADQVYLMGQSNGGLATLLAMSKQESDHPNKFAACFPVVPSCLNTSVKYGDYVRPVVIFGGDKDDANPVKSCIEMMKKKRADPIELIVYKDANHGFMENWKARTIYGWTDKHGKVHNWTLSYNKFADEDMMKTIISTIQVKQFEKGVEARPK